MGAKLGVCGGGEGGGFYYFNFEKNYDVSKSKSPWTLLLKNMNLIKTKGIENGKYHTASAYIRITN